MSTTTHPCPLCTQPVAHWDRYPQAVCEACSQQACDRQGRPLVLFNLGLGGGFGVKIAATQEDYPSHICYINGVECWADEHRLGGIVIQPHAP